MGFGYALYFSDRVKQRVVRWDPDSGDVDIVANTRTGADPSRMSSDPYGLTFSGGELVVSDKINSRISRIKAKRLEHIALKDPDKHRARKPESPTFYDPNRLASPTSLFGEPSGSVLCAFYDDNTIYRIHKDGRLELVLGKVQNTHFLRGEPLENVPASEARTTPLRGPMGVLERSDGTIFFVERDSQIVREYHPSRGLKSVFSFSQLGRWYEAPEAPPEGSLQEYHPVAPNSLALDREENLHLCDNIHASVLRIDLVTRRFKRCHLSHRKPNVYIDRGPLALAFGPDGTAWLADSAAESIQAYAVDKQGRWTPRDVRLTSVQNERLSFRPGGMGFLVSH